MASTHARTRTHTQTQTHTHTHTHTHTRTHAHTHTKRDTDLEMRENERGISWCFELSQPQGITSGLSERGRREYREMEGRGENGKRRGEGEAKRFKMHVNAER